MVEEEGVGEGLWAGEGSGTAEEGPGIFVTELCSCSGAVVDPGATAEDFASSVGSTTGVADVVLGVPAVNVVYPGSNVPLIPGQSMLKDAALKAVHSFRRTAVAPSLQSSVYIVTSSHHDISTAVIAKERGIGMHTIASVIQKYHTGAEDSRGKISTLAIANIESCLHRGEERLAIRVGEKAN